MDGPRGDYAVLVVPLAATLSTADVYRRADAMGLPRAVDDLRERMEAVAAQGGDLPDALVVNDLEPAARELCPAIGEALDAVRRAGADRALVCGSGPTVVGLFARVDAARGAAVALAGRRPPPIVAEPLRARRGEVAA
jgi:4-diphosphocytidyl-2-C-methyl-D-erythritol kinase